MKPLHQLRSSLQQRFQRLPIFQRLLLGNSIVIVVGAVGGTLLTHAVGDWYPEADLWLIGFFATAGILLSLLCNYWIIRTALQPLHELRQAVDQVQARPAERGAGGRSLRVSLTGDLDPDISRLARAINSMLERLETRAGQLHLLSERAINAQEEERKRIARGLHDDIGQSLSLLIIRLEHLENHLPAESGLRPELASLRAAAIRLLEDLRKVVYGLRPSMLDDLGLAPAIRWYARSNLQEAGVQVWFEGFDQPLRLASRLEINLFRIAQEAINNVLNHARATAVTVSLLRTDDQVCLSVEDDGQGFDIGGVAGQAVRLRRFGLLGIQERAELVGGRVAVESAPGRGTRLQVTVPFLETDALPDEPVPPVPAVPLSPGAARPPEEREWGERMGDGEQGAVPGGRR